MKEVTSTREGMKAGTLFQTKLSCPNPRSLMEWNQARRCGLYRMTVMIFG